ncbi:MAG: hypothetical protein HY897_00345 [Deltaproteobacteria bacterium]|nr:hypothetical protein [Deltaproteobacteria bacterium]
MAYEHYWEIEEDEEKLAYCRTQFGRTAKELGAQVKERLDDDEIWVTGKHDGRPYRVKTDVDMGYIELEMKIENRLGVVVVQYQAGEEESDSGDEGDRDEWDDSDGREAKHFLAPKVFLEEMPDELAPMKALLEQQPAVADHIKEVMPAQRIDRLRVDSDVLVVHFADDLVARDMVQASKAALATMGWLAGVFESGSSQVAEKPKVYIDGKPAAIGSSGALVTCKFCDQLVPLDARRRCPNCGGTN